jgi:hypothetical protein
MTNTNIISKLEQFSHYPFNSDFTLNDDALHQLLHKNPFTLDGDLTDDLRTSNGEDRSEN